MRINEAETIKGGGISVRLGGVEVEKVIHFFHSVDEFLANFAKLFGVGIVNPIPRHTLFFIVYGVIYASAIFAPLMVGFVALWVGYIGVLAIGRAWAQNEGFRTKIAKKLEDHDPDGLPDLRLTAALAAVQMILIVPLILHSSHSIFDLFDTPDETTWKTWGLFGLDLLFRSFLDWSEVYGVHISGVKLAATGGRNLVMFILLSIDFMIIQTVIRIVGINRTIQEGVAVAGKDPEMAFRIGRRATPKLAEMVKDENKDIDFRIKTIEALGMIGDSGGASALVELLADKELHTAATASLVIIGHFESLFHGIKHEDPLVRRGCVTALGRLEDSIANEILAEAIRDSDSGVRQFAHQAIGRIAHPSDIPLLRHGLSDDNVDVRFAALKQFSNFSSDQAMNAVISAVDDESAGIRRLAVEILARYPDPAVVPILAEAMQDSDSEVAAAAKRTVDHLESLVKGGAI
ncbi:MAG: HEAT repeat domain-containing protein [Candidatus Thalassarchaeaceae archaeon]|nr:HEAT repeat domain-containing protein [Candidatus Thalassarchaeaceae archaeon]